jgi:hypothetical protein
VHQDQEFPGHCDNGAFLCIAAAAKAKRQSPASQGGVPAKSSQHEVRTLHCQFSHELISSLGDSQLGDKFARVLLFGLEPEITAQIATIREAAGVIIEPQDEGERGQRSHARMVRIGAVSGYSDFILRSISRSYCRISAVSCSMIRIKGVRASRNASGQLSNAFFANAPVEQTVSLPPVDLTMPRIAATMRLRACTAVSRALIVARSS